MDLPAAGVIERLPSVPHYKAGMDGLPFTIAIRITRV
jgi:hypothetical protein